MPVLSAELVRRFARLRGGERPVVSLYLNVDGKQNVRMEDVLLRLDSMIKPLAAQEQEPSVLQAFERIKTYFAEEFDRGYARSAAVFADGDQLWEVVPLPLPVDDYLIVNSTPHVRRLEVLLDEHEPIGVLMTDKQKARMLVIHLGEVIERGELLEPLPRHDDDKGDWRKDHVKTHSDVAASAHLRHAAASMFELYQRQPFGRLVLCVAEELKPELERQLHSYLKTKVVGRCNLPMTASEEEVIQSAFTWSQKAEREVESAYVDRLRAGTSAVSGLDPTLLAIFEKRVETLLVSEGFTAEGWRCKGCSYIATLGRTCKICGDEMVLVDDVIEEAVEDALGQKCKVEFCSENADLDVLGRIGALLRF